MSDPERLARLQALTGGASSRRARLEAGYQGLLHDLNRERAGALGRAGRKVTLALAALAQAEAALDAPEDERSPATRWQAYAEAYAAAEHALWELRITREAAGLREHRDVLAAYPLPPRRRPPPPRGG